MGCGSSQTEATDLQKRNHSQKTNISSPDSSDLADKQKLYQRGNYLLEKQKYEQAISLFDRVLEIDPEFVDAYYSKAIIAFEQNQIEEAKKLFDITLEKDPDHIYALNEAGCLMIKRKKFSEALIYLEKAYAKQKDFAEVNYSLAYALSNLNRKEESLKYYDQAIKKDSEQKHFYINKASTLIELNKHEEALKCVSEALKLDQNYLEALITKGKIYKNIKQFEKLHSVSLTILKLDNENKLAQQMKQEAEQILNIQPTEQQSDMNKSIEDKLNLAQKFVSEKELIQARKVIDQILNQDPQHYQALKLQSQIQIELKEYADALDILNRLLSQQPKDIIVLKDKAFILEKLNRIEEALKCHNLILDEQPMQAKNEKIDDPQMKLGKATDLNQIHNKQPILDDPQAYILKGKLLYSQEKFEENINYLLDGLTKYQKNIEIMQLLAQNQKALKKEQEALNLHQQVLEIDKYNDCSHFEKCVIYYEQKLYQQALESLNKIKNTEFNELYYYYFGICYYNTGDYKEAIKSMQNYVKVGKKELKQAYFILGGAYLFLLKFDEAEESYLNCIKQDQKNAEAHYQLANVYKQDKQIEEAKKYYELAFNLEPYNEIYKSSYETFMNEKNFLVEYSNSLLFTLTTLIGICQQNQKSQDYDQQKNEKYQQMLLLLETNQKQRFKQLENHFEQIKELIAKSYDMQQTVIDDTMFPIMQFWYNQKICKKKKDINDFVSSIINTVKLLVNMNRIKILNVINSDRSLNNKYCMEFAEKSEHELYQKRSGCFGLIDGIKILGFLLKYHKEFNKDRMAFQELIATKYQIEEIQLFHESYYIQ